MSEKLEIKVIQKSCNLSRMVVNFAPNVNKLFANVG